MCWLCEGRALLRAYREDTAGAASATSSSPDGGVRSTGIDDAGSTIDCAFDRSDHRGGRAAAGEAGGRRRAGTT